MLYIVLALTGVTMVAVSWGTRLTPLKLGLWLMTCNAISMGDITASGFLELYRYTPHLLRAFPEDQYLGIVLTEYAFVPALVSAFGEVAHRMPLLAGPALTAPILLIEFAFRRIGIFHYSGWKLMYSAVLFSAVITALLYWAGKFEREGYNRLHRALLIFTAVNVMWEIVAITSDGVLNMWKMHPNLTTHTLKDNIAGALIYVGAPYMVMGFATVWFRWYTVRRWLVLLIGIFAVWYMVLGQLGIWRIRPPWSPFVQGTNQVLMIALSGYIDSWFLRHAPEAAGKAKAGAP